MPHDAPTPAPPAAPLPRVAWQPPRRRQLGAALVLLVCAGLYLPNLGRYGMFDPWETHYTEVARQLLERDDWLSPYWHNGVGPDGWAETNFWTKPVGAMWLSASTLRLLGYRSRITLRDSAVLAPGTDEPPITVGADPGEYLTTRQVEWAVRLPAVLCGLFGILCVYLMCRRLFGLRVALLAAFALATAPLWFLVSRQAMTDMPYVGPMSGGIALLAVAMFGERREVPRRSLAWRGLTLSWPHHPLFYGFLLTFALIMVLQLRALVPPLLRVPLWRVGERQLSAALWMTAYAALALAVLWMSRRARTDSELFLHLFYLLVGVAGLCKGLVGALLPGYIVLLYLLASREWRLLTELALGRGLLIAVAVACPWYHAMLLRHGLPFWQQLFGVEQLRRLMIGEQAQARGPWVYYLQQLGYALFPWVGFLPAAVARALAPDGEQERAGARARLFCFVWFAGALLLFTLCSTKYHYYFLPVLPPAAILAALFLDDLIAGRVQPALPSLVVAALVVALVAVDLARQPAHWVWLFTYLYDPEWAQGVPSGPLLWVYLGLCGALVVLLLLPRSRKQVVAVLAALAIALGGRVLDRYQMGCARHWSQKEVLRTYYRLRRSRSEPLVAWRFNWRGETWYTAAQVVVSLENDAPMRDWLARRAGRTVFFVMERGRFSSLGQLLPTARGRQTLKLVDGSAAHFVLARAEL